MLIFLTKKNSEKEKPTKAASTKTRINLDF